MGEKEKGKPPCKIDFVGMAASYGRLFLYLDQTDGKKRGDNVPSSDGYKNLVKRSREELKEMAKKGGQANAERIKREQSLNEVAKVILKKQVSESKAREILGEYATLLDEYTIGAILTMKQALEAQDGNCKAYEILRDTAGFKPVERQEITADIMTDADKALLEKVSRRVGVDPDKLPK
jgi:hypothetical protein